MAKELVERALRIVILPNGLPIYKNDSIDVHNEYKELLRNLTPVYYNGAERRAAATEASTSKSALTHVVFRYFMDRKDKTAPKMITSRLFGAGGYDIFTVQTVDVTNSDGSLVTDPKELESLRKTGEEGFLAADIARRLGINDYDAVDDARYILGRLVW